MGEERPTAFTVDPSGMARWVPTPGMLVKDTSCDRVGMAIAWDGEQGKVTLRPLSGGDMWHTATYRPANRTDQLRVRVSMLNHRGYTC
ncbi:hypothetical protein I5Q34_08745 [Streptomyces sp. AV19]|uniref:hypothetical protein n=1 Tax=Streptomyces sp. AV19 TaxID=2793068 RepID=UPI0018FE5C53|nr:hypothetical protein [Streptomyces sp. AV19]MBH1934377.1 hypothetical protein [Streptomyces sp. AV19]MDG4536225.1 hypothetical protein [Streptomyces sp. AV19]